MQKRVLGMSTLAEETAARGEGVTGPRYPFAFQVQQPNEHSEAMDEDQEGGDGANAGELYLFREFLRRITLCKPKPNVILAHWRVSLQ